MSLKHCPRCKEWDELDLASRCPACDQEVLDLMEQGWSRSEAVIRHEMAEQIRHEQSA